MKKCTDHEVRKYTDTKTNNCTNKKINKNQCSVRILQKVKSQERTLSVTNKKNGNNKKKQTNTINNQKIPGL